MTTKTLKEEEKQCLAFIPPSGDHVDRMGEKEEVVEIIARPFNCVFPLKKVLLWQTSSKNGGSAATGALERAVTLPDPK